MRITLTIAELPEGILKRFRSCNPKEVLKFTIHSSKLVIMVCECGIVLQSTPKTLTRSRYLCRKCGDEKSRQARPDNLVAINSPILEEWDYVKNLLPPENYTEMSGIKVWFIGKNCGHSFQTRVAAKSGGVKCLICSGKIIIPGINDLALHSPHLVAEWHPTKNGLLKPTQIAPKSNKRVWWLCKNHHEWQQKPLKRTAGYGCGKCSRSQLEKDISRYLNEQEIAFIENDRKVIAPYELDFIIPSLGIAIEANGNYWHSEEEVQRTRGISAVEFHGLKKVLSLAAGYELLFIWEDDWRKRGILLEEELSKVLSKQLSSTSFLKRLE